MPGRVKTTTRWSVSTAVRVTVPDTPESFSVWSTRLRVAAAGVEQAVRRPRAMTARPLRWMRIRRGGRAWHSPPPRLGHGTFVGRPRLSKDGWWIVRAWATLARVAIGNRLARPSLRRGAHWRSSVAGAPACESPSSPPARSSSLSSPSPSPAMSPTTCGPPPRRPSEASISIVRGYVDPILDTRSLDTDAAPEPVIRDQLVRLLAADDMRKSAS